MRSRLLELLEKPWSVPSAVGWGELANPSVFNPKMLGFVPHHQPTTL